MALTCPLWPSQEETSKAEGAEQEPSTPEADDDGRRHGFLILSREDSTMVKAGLGPGFGVP
jgi:cleavage and polyadenylation specificity factor subunit 1